MRMFRAEIVWAVLLAHVLAVVVCPVETVLCRTFDGSVKVEPAVNGACSKQRHDVPGQCRSSGQAAAFCSCRGPGHHGPCSDTLLSSSEDATCQPLLSTPIDGAIGAIAGPGEGVVVEHVVLGKSIDSPWQKFDLDMLRTVRLLA